MLKGLSRVDWDRLRHAYGNASDVPQLLLGLASSSPRKRRESLSSLYSTIWHQGTVYQATAAAVPILCAMLHLDDVPCKADILGLLQVIQSAHPQEDCQIDPIWREKRSALEAKQHTQSAMWARRARKAVSAEIDTFLSLLTHPSPFARGTAALILASCQNRTVDIAKRLRRFLETESHAGVKTALIYAWCRQSKHSRTAATSHAARLRHLVENAQEKPSVRLIAALGLESFSQEQTSTELVPFLAWAFRKSGSIVAFLARCGGSVDLFWELGLRRELRWDLYLELARKPNAFLKKQIIYDLEQLCRESRGNFAGVIPVLGGLLSDRDQEFRVTVAMTLSQMGTWIRLAQAPLVQALNDPHPPVAFWSAVALSKLRDPHVLPFVLENLAPELHRDLQECQTDSKTPATELQRIQHEGKHLLKLRLLMDALRSLGTGGRKALPQLRRLLTTRAAPTQKMVLGALVAIGWPSKSLITLVGKCLKDPNLQADAARTLTQWGSAATSAAGDLIALLQGGADALARRSAITALGLMGDAAKKALPVLQNELRSPDFMARCAAAVAIWRIAPQTEGISELLVNELREKTKPGWAIHGCIEVLTSIEAVGPAAKAAEPLLEKLLDDPNGWARVHSARALWKMGAKVDRLLPVLIDDLLCRPLGIAAGQLAAECLAEIGLLAAAAIPRLTELLAREESLAHRGTGWVESDESYRRAIANALSAIRGNENGEPS